MKHLFVVTSAVKTKFKVNSEEARLSQTLMTVRSILARVPDAMIVVIEASGIPLDEHIVKALEDEIHYLINFSSDPNVQHIHDNNENADIVKNLTEMMCFYRGLQMLRDADLLTGVNRVYKMSGRYLLNKDFKLSLHEQSTDKILISNKYQTQFSEEYVGIPYQYMSRLWSWPIKYNEKIMVFYETAIKEFTERIENKKYADIEHLLYLLLPSNLIQEVNPIGVSGKLGNSGLAVKD